MRGTAGDRIRRARFEKGLTLRQLHDLTGVGINTIHRFETGLTKPYGHTLFRLADALELDPDELLDLLERESA